MKTLIVAGNQFHAKDIRRQTQGNKKVQVIAPGDCIGQRFDMILVTDQYRRERHFTPEEGQARLDRWFNESVLCRLSGPEAHLIQL
jgi:hypothetical protein